MEVRFALGAVADLASSDELKSSIDGLQGHMDNRFRELTKEHAIRRTIQGSDVLTLSSGQTQVTEFNPGRPALGRVWSITRLTLLGADDHSSVANLSAALYIGDPANPHLGTCIIPNLSVTSFQTFNKENLWVHDTESLFINWTASGVLTGQQVVISATVSDSVDSSKTSQFV